MFQVRCDFPCFQSAEIQLNCSGLLRFADTAQGFFLES